jgi:hypothetical protein
MPTPSGSLAPVGVAKREVVAIKVKFELNARNGLRRVMFSLEKDTDGDAINWKIQFQLFERDNKTVAYVDPLVDLEIEVDTVLHNKAQTTADKGMTPGQSAHALGPAADDAKAAAAGELDPSEAKGTIQATLRKK